MRTLFLFLLCLISSLEGSPPQEVVTEEANKPEQSYNYGREFVNMLFTLAFVIALIFLTVWLLKKLMRSRVKSLNQANGIKILERRPLSSKSSLYLIDILGKGIVISESAAGVHLVTEFPDSAEVELLLEKKQALKKTSPSFRDVLAQKMSKKKMGSLNKCNDSE